MMEGLHGIIPVQHRGHSRVPLNTAAHRALNFFGVINLVASQ